MKRRSKANDWATRIEAWRASGKTAEVFCVGKPFKATTLRWWSWKLGADARSGATPIAFAQLVTRPTPRPARDQAIELVLRGGRSVRVTRGFDPNLLREIVDALEVR